MLGSPYCYRPMKWEQLIGTNQIQNDCRFVNNISTDWQNCLLGLSVYCLCLLRLSVSSNPTPTPLKAPFNDTLTTWPLYDWNDNLKIFYLDGEISVVETYRQQQYAFYVSYLSKMFGRPVKTRRTGRPCQQLYHHIQRFRTHLYPNDYWCCIVTNIAKLQAWL